VSRHSHLQISIDSKHFTAASKLYWSAYAYAQLNLACSPGGLPSTLVREGGAASNSTHSQLSPVLHTAAHRWCSCSPAKGRALNAPRQHGLLCTTDQASTKLQLPSPA
jgi:hypothetical protein